MIVRYHYLHITVTVDVGTDPMCERFHLYRNQVEWWFTHVLGRTHKALTRFNKNNRIISLKNSFQKMNESSVVEGMIAKRFGIEANGEGFSLIELEPVIGKLQSFRIQHLVDTGKLFENVMLKKRKKSSYVCRNLSCKNKDEELFEKDNKLAQVTCTLCGTVAQERLIEDKDWSRQFEEDGNENHSNYSKPPDVRFSAARNLRTGLIAQPGQKSRVRELQALKNAAEMCASRNAGLTQQGHTRVGYKDNSKAHVFELMHECGDVLQLNETVLNLAKDTFANYRDTVEKMPDLYRVAAACMLIAFRERRAQDEDGNRNRVHDAPQDKEFVCHRCKLPFNTAQCRRLHLRKCEG